MLKKPNGSSDALLRDKMKNLDWCHLSQFLHDRLATRYADDHFTHASIPGDINAWTDQIVPTLRVNLPEEVKRIPFEVSRVDLAFDGIHIPPATQNEIHLMSGFISPEIEIGCLTLVITSF